MKATNKPGREVDSHGLPQHPDQLKHKPITIKEKPKYYLPHGWPNQGMTHSRDKRPCL